MPTTKPLQTALDAYRRELSHLTACLEAEIDRVQRIESAYAPDNITADHMRTPLRVIDGLGDQLAELAAEFKATAAKAKASF